MYFANDSDSAGRQAGATIMEVAYGRRALPENDPSICAAEQAVKFAAEGGRPGRFWVETLPWLKHVPAWLPGAGFQVLARTANRFITITMDEAYYETKKAVVSPFGILLLCGRLMIVWV